MNSLINSFRVCVSLMCGLVAGIVPNFIKEKGLNRQSCKNFQVVKYWEKSIAPFFFYFFLMTWQGLGGGLLLPIS